MTIQEVYEKYRHMDDSFMSCNAQDGFMAHIIYDLWQAIKKTIGEQP